MLQTLLDHIQDMEAEHVWSVILALLSMYFWGLFSWLAVSTDISLLSHSVCSPPEPILAVQEDDLSNKGGTFFAHWHTNSSAVL